jgi:hypothetical protein
MNKVERFMCVFSYENRIFMHQGGLLPMSNSLENRPRPRARSLIGRPHAETTDDEDEDDDEHDFHTAW